LCLTESEKGKDITKSIRKGATMGISGGYLTRDKKENKKYMIVVRLLVWYE
jgi:hypothetical protein